MRHHSGHIGETAGAGGMFDANHKHWTITNDDIDERVCELSLSDPTALLVKRFISIMWKV